MKKYKNTFIQNKRKYKDQSYDEILKFQILKTLSDVDIDDLMKLVKIERKNIDEIYEEINIYFSVPSCPKEIDVKFKID